MNKGLFISFEGPDGCGKTTQIRLFKEYLSGLGYEVILTREPGGTQIAEQIRSLILNAQNTEETALTEMFLFAAQRAQNVAELIKPAIAEGKIVLCDRFVDSSIAYQGYGRGLGDKVREVNDIAIQGCMPDITFFLDVSPELAKERNKGLGKEDRLEKESLEFGWRVYEGYKAIESTDKNRIVRIDASKSIEDVQQQIRDAYMFAITTKR